jgi:hypothetical protein
MELIDRYIYEIGENLPEKNRADIEAEIRSVLQDTLDSRSTEEGRPIDEEMVVAVLKEFGSPEKVAQSYQEPRYLIGPRMFPIFWMVLRIVMVVILIVATVGLGVRLSQPDVLAADMPEMVLQAIAGLANSALAALGNLVFIFAILDYFIGKKIQASKEWDPRKLSDKPAGEQVNPVGTIVEITLNAVVLLLLNFYPNLIAVYWPSGGQWASSPIFSEVFFRYLPFINLILLFDIVKDLLLLRQRAYTRGLVWMGVVHSVLNIILVGMMLSGPSIINDQSIVASGISQFETLARLAGSGIRFVLILVMVLEVVELVKNLVRLYGKKVKLINLPTE